MEQEAPIKTLEKGIGLKHRTLPVGERLWSDAHGRESRTELGEAAEPLKVVLMPDKPVLYGNRKQYASVHVELVSTIPWLQNHLWVEMTRDEYNKWHFSATKNRKPKRSLK